MFSACSHLRVLAANELLRLKRRLIDKSLQPFEREILVATLRALLIALQHKISGLGYSASLLLAKSLHHVGRQEWHDIVAAATMLSRIQVCLKMEVGKLHTERF